METTKLIRNSLLLCVFFFVISAILTSCCPDDTYNYLSDEETPIWGLADTLIYESNLGNIDTMIVISYRKILESDQSKDFCNPTTYTETASVSICKPYNPNDYFIYFYVIATKNRKSKKLSIDDRDFYFHDYIKSEDEISIRGNLYSNVFIIKDTHATPVFEHIYYNHKNGVLEYSYSTGETWTLKNINK